MDSPASAANSDEVKSNDVVRRHSMRSAASAESSFSPSIPEVIEQIGYGQGQVQTMVLACGPFLAEGLELLMVSLLVHSIATDLHADTGGKGMLVSVVFSGITLGNVLSGPFADLTGRQFPIILGYAFVIVFSVSSSFMSSLQTIAALRFFVGLGIGVAQPAAIALMSELTPRRWRLASTACSAFFFSLGVLLAVLMVTLQDVWLKDLSMLEWRLLLRIASLPMLALGLVSILLLPESPAFLAANGDYALARDALRMLAARNKADAVVDFKCSAELVPLWQVPAWQQVRQLLSPQALASTTAVCCGSLIMNFALYGTSYVVPQVLTEVLEQGVQTMAPATVLLLTVAMANFVLAVGASKGSMVGRKTGIIACLLVSLASSLLFNSATAIHHPRSVHRLLLIFSCFGLCAGPAFAILLLIQASTEMYPTLTSASAVSACLAVGRLGAIASPLVFDRIESSTGRWQPFFVLMALLELVCALMIAPLDLSKPRLLPSGPLAARGWSPQGQKESIA